MSEGRPISDDDRHVCPEGLRERAVAWSILVSRLPPGWEATHIALPQGHGIIALDPDGCLDRAGFGATITEAARHLADTLGRGRETP